MATSPDAEPGQDIQQVRRLKLVVQGGEPPGREPAMSAITVELVGGESGRPDGWGDVEPGQEEGLHLLVPDSKPPEPAVHHDAELPNRVAWQPRLLIQLPARGEQRRFARLNA